MQKTLTVEGMACAHCEGKVKKALEAVPGVVEAVADHNTNTAVVTLSAPVEDAVLIEAVNATKFKATAIC